MDTSMGGLARDRHRTHRSTVRSAAGRARHLQHRALSGSCDGDALTQSNPFNPWNHRGERVFDGPWLAGSNSDFGSRTVAASPSPTRKNAALELSLTAERIAPIRYVGAATQPSSRDEGHLWSLLHAWNGWPRLGVEEIRLRAVHTADGNVSGFWPDPSSSIRPEQSVSWGQMLDQLTERIGRRRHWPLILRTGRAFVFNRGMRIASRNSATRKGKCVRGGSINPLFARLIRGGDADAGRAVASTGMGTSRRGRSCLGRNVWCFRGGPILAAGERIRRHAWWERPAITTRYR